MDYQRLEQRLLWQSAALMTIVAIAGTFVGVVSNSYAILVDGIFSFVAVIIKLMMLATSKLTAKENSRLFQFGYWQFEPLVLIAEGSFTLVLVVYAGITALIALLNGGHDVNFGIAIWYGIFFAIADTSYYFYVRKVNKRLRSNLVRFDNVSWAVDAAFATGLLASFGIAEALTYTDYAYYTRFVDPCIIVLLTIQMVPTALNILVPAVKQILGVAPSNLHEKVQQEMDNLMVKYGFRDYVSSVQQYGSMKIIDIDVLIRKSDHLSVSKMDEIRTEIDQALGGKRVDKWLTVTFTASRKWMTRDYDVIDEED